MVMEGTLLTASLRSPFRAIPSRPHGGKGWIAGWGLIWTAAFGALGSGCTTAPPPTGPPTPPPLVIPRSMPLVVPFADGVNWMLVQPLEVTVGDPDHKIVVPAGFITDFASIPKALCVVLPAQGRYTKAAILHDYLYWSQRCTRAESDNIFLAAMLAGGVDSTTARTLKSGVEFGGQAAWDENQTKKREGMVRVIPYAHRKLPENQTWEQYRWSLHAQGVAEAPSPPTDDCFLGDPLESRPRIHASGTL